MKTCMYHYFGIVAFNLGLIEPQGLVVSIQGFGVHMMRGTVCAFILYITVYICFEFEGKSSFYFSNYIGLDESMYGACGA